MHGMSAALLAGEPGLEAVFGDEPRAPLQPRHLHMFGIRSVDRGEKELLRSRGINVIDMRLIDECGVGVLLRRVLDTVAGANAQLHVSLDIDFLDPALAPGVGTTVPGGATSERPISSWSCCTTPGWCRPLMSWSSIHFWM